MNQEQPKEHQRCYKATFKHTLHQFVPKHTFCSVIKHTEWVVKENEKETEALNPFLYPT